MKFFNFIKKLQKGGFFALSLLVGLGFLVFSLLPIVLPGKFTTDSPMWMTALFIAIGLGLIVLGVVNLKKVATTSLEEENYFDKVDKTEVKPEVIEKIKNSDEPEKEYYFHYCGHLNQSYILETPDRVPVYEINCDKMGIVSDYVFTFKNHLTGNEFTGNVSHTVTTSFGDDKLSLVDQSYFKIDGKNIWDYIGDMGYSTEPYLDGMVLSFRIKHYGVEVAELKAAGTNILPQYEGKGGLRDIPMGGGLYRVTCREEDVEAVAMIAFAVSRVQIVTN